MSWRVEIILYVAMVVLCVVAVSGVFGQSPPLPGQRPYIMTYQPETGEMYPVLEENGMPAIAPDPGGITVLGSLPDGTWGATQYNAQRPGATVGDKTFWEHAVDGFWDRFLGGLFKDDELVRDSNHE